jgi:hypothetical protein
MKSKVIMFLAALVVATAGVVGSAQAENDGTEIANVPFDFYAGGHKMLAGNYTIWFDVETRRIRISDASGKHQMFLLGTLEEDSQDTPELVFEHSGDFYALQEVRSNVIDMTFPATLPKEATASLTSSPQVEVALNRR